MSDVQDTIKYLLANNLVAEDLVLVKDEDELLTAAFLRLYGDGSNKYIKIRIGRDDHSFEYTQLLEYFKYIDKPPEFKYITVPKRMALSDIEDVLSQTNIGEFSTLDDKSIAEVLFNLGFDTKYNYRSGTNDSWWFEYILYRNNTTNKVEYGKVVVGNERIDKKWLSSGFASYEAKVYTSDMELAKDIQGLRGSKRKA